MQRNGVWTEQNSEDRGSRGVCFDIRCKLILQIHAMQRKSFLTKLSTASAAIIGFSSFQQPSSKKELKNCFIHHVYFWLKNPDSKADLEQLVAGLKKLSTVKTIQQFHIGKPAATRRDVIESSYAVSWFTQFANAADEEQYQTDPIHLKFIEECSHLWSKVTVYDAVDM